jgi:hypothetical protein
MSYAFENLRAAVVDASEADNWSDAVGEWYVSSCEIDDDCEETCICGQENLRYLYTIRNRLNGNVLYPIGSRCIKRFENPDMDEDAEYLRRLEMLDEMGKHGIWESDWSELKPLLSRGTIEWLYSMGALEDRRCVSFSGDDDRTRELLLKTFNRRCPSYKQIKAVKAILSYCVLPWYEAEYCD